MKRVADVFLFIFAIGILLCLFAGGISLVGYIIALIVGGNFAVEICSFVFQIYLPWVIRITSVVTGVGLIGMYLSKIQTLSILEHTERKK